MGKNRHNRQQGANSMNDQTQQQSTDQSNTSTEGESTSDEGQLQGAENTSATETSGESTTQAPLGIDPSAPVVEVALQFKPKEQEPAPAVKQAVKQASAPAPSSSQNVTKIEQQLVSYMDGMTPSIALDPKVGGQYQNFLFNMLRTVLNNSDQDQFRREWMTILNVFNKNKEGVFHENYIMRFPQHWNLSDSEGALFRRLIAVIIQTAAPDNRASFGSNVRLDTVVEGLNAVQKNNFLNFYA